MFPKGLILRHCGEPARVQGTKCGFSMSMESHIHGLKQRIGWLIAGLSRPVEMDFSIDQPQGVHSGLFLSS